MTAGRLGLKLWKMGSPINSSKSVHEEPVVNTRADCGTALPPKGSGMGGGVPGSNNGTNNHSWRTFLFSSRVWYVFQGFWRSLPGRGW